MGCGSKTSDSRSIFTKQLEVCSGVQRVNGTSARMFLAGLPEVERAEMVIKQCKKYTLQLLVCVCVCACLSETCDLVKRRETSQSIVMRNWNEIKLNPFQHYYEILFL